MVEVQLSKKTLTKAIVTLNANMIGYFPVSGFAGGVHIGHVKSVEITTNRKGKHALLIKTELTTFMNNEEVDDEALARVQDWVAEVQRAMQAFAA